MVVAVVEAAAAALVLVALVGVGWLLSRAEGGAAGWLEVGVGACEGVVCVLEAGETSYFDFKGIESAPNILI